MPIDSQMQMSVPLALSPSTGQSLADQHGGYAHLHSDPKLTEPGEGWHTQPMQQHAPVEQAEQPKNKSSGKKGKGKKK